MIIYIQHKFAVWVHRVIGPEDPYGIIYYGYGRTIDALKTDEPMKKKRYVECLEISGGRFSVEIVEQFDTILPAKRLRDRLVSQMTPCPPGNDMKAYTTMKRVYCNETGQVWQSVSDAAIAQVVHKSTMSNHLAGRVGYPRINGFTFRKI